MKKTLFLTLSLFALLCSVEMPAVASTQASPFKLGYADVDYILSLLPEAKKVKSEYASFEKQLVNQLETKGREYQQKLQALQQGYETMTEEVRNKKQLELQQLGKSFEQMQQEGQKKLAAKYADLVSPLYTKIQSIVEIVAKKYGYTFIINTNTGGAPLLLYATEEHNISELVLKQLGINTDKKKSSDKGKVGKNKKAEKKK